MIQLEEIRRVAQGLLANSCARDIHGTIGLHEIGQYIELWRILQNRTLNNEEDRAIWRWTADGVYTASFCYLAAFQGAIACFSWKLTWKSWPPPKVKFFIWLAHLDRCWTAELLARHGLQHHPRCPLCDQAMEIIRHLLLECPVARQAWHETLTWLRMTAAPPENEASIAEWWQQAKTCTPKLMRKGLASISLLIPWMTWKHRNRVIFDGIQPSAQSLIDSIKEEARLWARAGARGLRVVLPTTWDVH